MTWIVIGIILFIIELTILKNTTYFWLEKVVDGWGCKRWERSKEEKPVKVRLWWVILLALGNIGWVSLITFPIFWIVWGLKAGRDTDNDCGDNTYWRLHSKLMKKLINILNKEI